MFQDCLRPHGYPDRQAFLCYVFTVNLTAKPVRVPEFKIVTSVSNSLSCIIQACNDKKCMTVNRGQTSTQLDLTNVVHAVHYKSPEPGDEHGHRHNAEKKRPETRT